MKSLLMNRKLKTRLMTVGIVLALAGVIYAFYALYAERNRLAADLADTRGRLAQTEKKYQQEKTLSQGLLRSKQSLEGLLRGMEAKLAEAREDNQRLVSEKEHLEENWVKKLEDKDKTIAELNDRIEKIKAVRDEIIARYKEKVQEVEARDLAIADLSRNLKETDYELKRTRNKLDTCGEHNARLCTINEELVDMYQNKGLLNVISVTEPLTQLRKVEMEKMVQQYKTRIDENNAAKTVVK
ncbi:hypothetical protein JCM14469_14490 [Desulfatiferula olefinivorans]